MKQERRIFNSPSIELTRGGWRVWVCAWFTLWASGCVDPEVSSAPCPAGSFGLGVGACTDCDVGSFCPQGTHEQTPCVPGINWDADADPATDCVVLEDCGPSEFQSVTPTATRDRGCQSLAVCAVDEYVAVEPLPSRDRVCEPFSMCEPGEYIVVDGGAASDRRCRPCSSGTFSALTNQSSCERWMGCEPGTYVSVAGSTMWDRTCTACATGTFTRESNWAACATWKDCEPGEFLWRPGSDTSNRICSGCPAGTFTDSLNEMTCSPFSVCEPGEYVTAAGTSAGDQVCDACAFGEYSVVEDATACIPWNPCGAGLAEVVPGSESSDRVCAIDGFPRQFGTADSEGDSASAVAVDEFGGVIVAGTTGGEFPGQTSFGHRDSFVLKYDSGDGSILWFDQFGSTSYDGANDVAVGAGGNVHVVGTTRGRLPDTFGLGGKDAYLRTYAPNGAILWTRQIGTGADDHGASVAVDASGAVYVAGSTKGTFAGQSKSGDHRDWDVFVQRYSEDGELLWTRQFGSSEYDSANDISVDELGNMFVIGSTSDTSNGYNDAWIGKYDVDGGQVWTRQFGTEWSDYGASGYPDGAGGVFMVGSTSGVLPGQLEGGPNPSDFDVFLRRYDGDGVVLWTRQFGWGAHDSASSIFVNDLDELIVSGSTSGSLHDAVSLGRNDAFLRSYDADGNKLWTHQFGTSSDDWASDVCGDGSGGLLVVGGTWGEFPGEVSQGYDDAYVMQLSLP